MLFARCSHAVVPNSACCQSERSHNLAQPRRLRCPLPSQALLVRDGLAPLSFFTCLYSHSSTYPVPFPLFPLPYLPVYNLPIPQESQCLPAPHGTVSALAPDVRPSSPQSEGRTLSGRTAFPRSAPGDFCSISLARAVFHASVLQKEGWDRVWHGPPASWEAGSASVSFILRQCDFQTPHRRPSQDSLPVFFCRGGILSCSFSIFGLDQLAQQDGICLLCL